MSRRGDDDEGKTGHIDVPLGERLRQERDARRLTRARMAQMLDVSESTIQQWEEGRTRLPAARLWQVCNLLEIEVSAFFGDMPHHVERTAADGVIEAGPPFTPNVSRGRKVSAVARAAARLPDDRLAIALDLVKALKPKG